MNTQTISRENFKKIWDVACGTWKTKLEGWAAKTPFHQTDIELTDSQVEEMYSASDAKQTVIIKKFLKKAQSITDRVNSYEDACKVLGIKNTKRTAFERLIIIIKALNEGWFPDFDNDNQYKFYNYFRQVKGVFSFFAVYCRYSSWFYPSALYLKSEELAKHAAKIALKDYEEFYKTTI